MGQRLSPLEAEEERPGRQAVRGRRPAHDWKHEWGILIYFLKKILQ